MKITRLNNPNLLLMALQKRLMEFCIELFDIEIGRKNLKFRAKRTFNKPYAGGGVKWGEPANNNDWHYPKMRQARYLHYEEWALINDTINDVCDEYGLGGRFSSWFDGKQRLIRDCTQENPVLWSGDYDYHMELLENLDNNGNMKYE